jgi:hypothetical protein
MHGTANPENRVFESRPLLHKYCMLMDWHRFDYSASVPWPTLDQDWYRGIEVIEQWLNMVVGPRYVQWAYDDCNILYNIGVAFRWDQDRTLFVLTWS